MPPPDDCPDPAEFEAMLLGQASDDRANFLESHVEECLACQRRVDGMAVNTRLTAVLRQGLAEPPEEAAGLEDLMARLDDLASQFASLGWSDADPAGDGARGEERPVFAPPVAAGEVGRLQPYRVLRLLGAGGMGLVYLAEDTVLKRPVALKLLRPHLARHPLAQEGFLSEARAMAAIKHDNVVTVFQVGETPSADSMAVPFLAMELLEGESLGDWVRREGPMPAGWAARLGQQTADGLAVAHARGVIHRDIKPGNLWLEAPRGWADLPADRRPPLPSVARLKILDFGLAQPVGEDEPAGDRRFGTPAYMPPEQARGEPLSPAADLFSLGVVLYELTSGKLPFAHSRKSARPAYHPPADLRRLAADVGEPFAALVHRLLAMAPRDRPASAQEVVAELAALSAPSGPETVPFASAPTVPVRARPARRWRVLAGVAAAAVAALVALWLARPAGHGYQPDKAGDHAPNYGPDHHLLAGPPDAQWCRAVANLPAERQSVIVVLKLRELNPGYLGEIMRLRFEKGQVVEFVILTDAVSDLRPVSALTGLRMLGCYGSAPGKGKLSDLSPIRGLRLETLNVWENPDLRDLDPARGMPLRVFQAGDTAVENLSPLEQMPLTLVAVNNCHVRDVGPVRNMPKLATFRCDGCPIDTLAPLVESSLKELMIDYLPERGDADVLRRMPRLTRINYKPAEEFRQARGLVIDPR